MRRLLYYTRELHHYIYLTSWFPSAGAVPSPLSRPPPLRSSQSSAPEQQEEEEATDRDREGEEGDKSFWTWLQRLILLFCPEGDDARRPSQSSGGAAGGLALVGIVTLLIVLYLRHRRRTSDSSESNSSGRALPDMQSARCMTLEELQSATNNFSSSNLVGHGMFGEVYNGLLQDGTVIAVKRRHSPPSQEFLHEVNYLLSIHHHRNLVNLLGYCQDNGMQMLVYQYVPNGSISTHLHGNGHSPTVRLEFKQRLAIAHGAAKGLSHLHSMTPPAVHMNFKTANVLVDADFVPKVADTGIRGLLDRLGNAGPPSMIFNDPFVDPRGKESMIFSIQSDVYSFGVFLLELISGRTAVSDQGIIEWVRNFQESSDISAIADRRMTSVFTSLGMKELLRLASRCVNPASENRPSMSLVEAEIHRIHEQEIGMTTIMPRGNTTVALGSQLFTSSR